MLTYFLGNGGGTTPYTLSAADINEIKGSWSLRSYIECDIFTNDEELAEVDIAQMPVKSTKTGFNHYFLPIEDTDLFFAFGTLNVQYRGTVSAGSGCLRNYKLKVTLTKNLYNFKPATHKLGYLFQSFRDAWLLEDNGKATPFTAVGTFEDDWTS